MLRRAELQSAATEIVFLKNSFLPISSSSPATIRADLATEEPNTNVPTQTQILLCKGLGGTSSLFNGFSQAPAELRPGPCSRTLSSLALAQAAPAQRWKPGTVPFSFWQKGGCERYHLQLNTGFKNPQRDPVPSL